MVDLWFVSDTHFGHANMIHKFKLEDGSPSRSFASVDEMDETMIDRWNEVVRPSDHVYHLGDVTMHRQIGQIRYSVLNRLNGHERLLLGNHDLDTVEHYREWFEKVMSYRVLDRLIFSHVPIHPMSLGRFQANIHGHTHHQVLPASIVCDHKGYGERDRTVPFINVCVEQIDYRPVSLDWIKAKVARAS